MDLVNILVRLLQYGALLPLFGLTAFAIHAQDAQSRRDHRQVVIVLTAIGLLTALASLLILAAMMSGDPAGAADPATLSAAIIGTSAGRAGLLRVAALALLLGLVRFGGPLSRLICAAVALATLAWAGHAAGGEGLAGALHLSADVLDLWVAGIWLGALVALCAMVAARRPDPAATADVLAAPTERSRPSPSPTKAPSWSRSRRSPNPMGSMHGCRSPTARTATTSTSSLPNMTMIRAMTTAARTFRTPATRTPTSAPTPTTSSSVSPVAI